MKKIQEWYAARVNKTVEEFDEHDMHICKVISEWEKSKRKTLKVDPEGTYHHNENMNKAIQEFILHRQEIKKPLTPTGMSRMLKTFKGFTVGECIAAIETAIMGRYQGVFPKKEFKKFGTQSAPPVSGDKLRNADYSEGI